MVKNRSDLEAEISQAFIRFEKEFMGRGPLEARTYILEDLVVVRLKGVLTPAEIKLAQAQDAQRGRYLLKQVRQELLDRGRPLLEAAIKDILGIAIKSLHTDISTKTGERIIAFTLEGRPRHQARSEDGDGRPNTRPSARNAGAEARPPRNSR